MNNNALGINKDIFIDSINNIEEYFKFFNVTTIEEFLNELQKYNISSEYDKKPVITSQGYYSGLIAILQNIIKLIGNLPTNNKTIGSNLVDLISRTESVVDLNKLLDVIVNALGIGIYNNGKNGMIHTFNYDSSNNVATFFIDDIAFAFSKNKQYYIENLGEKRFEINFKELLKPSSVLKFNIALSTSTDTAVVEFLSRISLDLVTTDDYGYYFTQELTNPNDISTFNTLVTNKQIILLYVANFTYNSSSVLTDVVFNQMFTPSYNMNYFYKQLTNTLNGDGTILEVPSNIDEKNIKGLIVNNISNINISILTGTVSSEFEIYVIPYDEYLVQTLNPESNYLYKYSHGLDTSSRFQRNSKYVNKVGNVNKLLQNKQVCLYVKNINDSTSVFNINITSNEGTFKYKVYGLNDNDYFFPLNTNHLFKDPFYYNEYSNNNGTDIKQVELYMYNGLSGRSFKDRSITETKYGINSINSNVINNNAIEGRHISKNAKDNVKVHEWNGQLPTERLDYTSPTIGTRCEFNSTKDVYFSIGNNPASSAIKLINSSIANTEHLYYIPHVHSIQNDLDIYTPQIRKSNTRYTNKITLLQGHTTQIASPSPTILEVDKLQSNTLETVGLILTSNKDTDNTDNTKINVSLHTAYNPNTKDVMLGIYTTKENGVLVPAALSTGQVTSTGGQDYVDAESIANYPNTHDINWIHGRLYGIKNRAIVLYDNTCECLLGFASTSPGMIITGNHITNINEETFPLAVSGFLTIYINDVYTVGDYVIPDVNGTVKILRREEYDINKRPVGVITAILFDHNCMARIKILNNF